MHSKAAALARVAPLRVVLSGLSTRWRSSPAARGKIGSRL